MMVPFKQITSIINRIILRSNQDCIIWLCAANMDIDCPTSFSQQTSIFTRFREASRLASRTDWYSTMPMEQHALRPLVPWFTAVHDEHLSPKWQSQPFVKSPCRTTAMAALGKCQDDGVAPTDLFGDTWKVENHH